MNQFLQSINKFNTLTENGAIAHSTTGSTLADQFSKAGSHRGRNISVVFAEQSQLHNQYGIWALRFVFYLRMITRVVKFFDESTTCEVQRGQGNRDESYKRYLWYLANYPEVFYKNLDLFCTIGSEKDMFELLWYAEQYKISVDIKKCLMETIISTDGGIFNNNLLLKYLPLQKANSKCKTDRAKFRNKLAKIVANIAELNAKDLRKLKSSGQAHTWQQHISRKLFQSIDFNKISGKALLNLVSGKFLTNHNLENKYIGWIKSKPVAKFTGYVYQLGAKVKHNISLALKYTIDKQFEGLIQLTKDSKSSKRKVICAIDRSGSMETPVANTTAMNIAESLGIYFSSLLEGEFKDWVIRFSRRSEWLKLTGSFSEKKLQMDWGDCPSNTDFQSIIDSFVRTRKNFPNIPESDFPDTLLVVSDMQFDMPSFYRHVNMDLDTNYQIAKQKLSEVFSSEYCNNFIFIWWDCTSRITTNQPQNIEEPGGYFMSGFDGAALTLLLGSIENKEKVSVEQSIEDILSQETLLQVIL
jgi:hypothetical protein